MKNIGLKITTGALGVTLLFIVLLSVQTVPKPTLENSVKIEGQLLNILADQQTKDLVFEIAGHTGTYYINRGLELEINVDELKEEILNEDVSVYYVKTSNLIANATNTQHISRIALRNKVLYDEIEQ
ncbi:MAG: hypothetical protein RIC35_09485 [Marinoscillum sp.]